MSKLGLCVDDFDPFGFIENQIYTQQVKYSVIWCLVQNHHRPRLSFRRSPLLWVSLNLTSGILDKLIRFLAGKYVRLANIAMLSQGCAIGWVSPSLPILRSDKSQLTTGPLNIREAAWVGSLLSLAAIVGTAIFGYLTKWIGSKRSLVVCVIPGFVS